MSRICMLSFVCNNETRTFNFFLAKATPVARGGHQEHLTEVRDAHHRHAGLNAMRAGTCTHELVRLCVRVNERIRMVWPGATIGTPSHLARIINNHFHWA